MMSIAEFVSARDDHSLAQDAQMFFIVSNAMMDAGIATWESKVHYDYARPVRVVRDLGELGLIGEPGTDEITGETGSVIDAWGGVDDATGADLGTRTILAENFVPYQRWHADVSPPFAEHTSGHSGFSAAGAKALELFTGSDAFGGSVTFTPGSAQFLPDTPSESVELVWPTFTEVAEQSGESRLYGQIHFSRGNESGLALGDEVGAMVYAQAQAFFDGTATDVERPFWTDDVLV